MAPKPVPPAPPDEALVRFVEALARAAALRDHRAAIAARDAARAKST